MNDQPENAIESEGGRSGDEQSSIVEEGHGQQIELSGVSNHGFKNSNEDLHQIKPTNGDLPKEFSDPDPEDPQKDYNSLGIVHVISRLQIWLQNFYKTHKTLFSRLLLLAITVLYFVYFGYAIHLSWSKSESWCDGSKFLTICTICVVFSLCYFFILKKYVGKKLNKCLKPVGKVIDRISSLRFFSIIAFVVLMAAIFIFVIVDAKGRHERLISYGGLWTLLFLGFVFSKHPRKVILRHVTWGIGLQFAFALIILRWKVGKDIFQCLGDKVAAFLAFTDDGSNFMFGYLASGNLASGNASMDSLVIDGTSHNATAINIILPHQISIFAFKVLPVVLFFSFCVAILYYYGVMQWIVLKVGWLLQVTIGTTAAESMNAAGNIFMGQSEAPLLIRPYLSLMTKSELHAIMTGGFATIAGSVLAAYISLGISASHLLSASVMSAPAALGFSKLFYPETEDSRTTISEIRIEKGKERNALEAASVGVTQAVTLVAVIAANLIAFIAFIYFVDNIIMWFGSLVGWDYISLTWLMSKVFMPLAYMMGVRWEECDRVGELIGLKTVVNEFVAYERLSKIKDSLSKRSQLLATYALCGFSNLSSIGIQLGGLGSMAPDRISDLAQVAFRAMISGSVACFLTACIAGAIIADDA